MDGLKQDLVYCFRMMQRSPAFTAVAVVTLALVIGANTAIISLADALFRRGIPGANTERAVGIYASYGGRIFEPSGFSHDDYLRLRSASGALSQISAHYSTSPLTLSREDGARIVLGGIVTAELFRLFGVRPAVGRFFTDEEDRPGSPAPVAVLAFSAWQEWFGGDSAVVGRTVTLNGTPFTVIGVAPADFQGALMAARNEVWIPMSMLGTGYRFCGDVFAPRCRVLALFGRIAPGRELGEAQAELSVLARQLAGERDTTDGAFALEVLHLRGVEQGVARGEHRTVVALLLAAAALLLVVACANLAGTLLVRGIARRREIAVRRAVGATPARIVRQLALEGVVLSLLGAAAGLLVAAWIQPPLQALYVVNQFHFDLRLGPAVMAGATVLAVVAGLAFGIGPALQAARTDLTPVLKGDAGTGGSSRAPLRDGLLAMQVALACVGLVGAGMLVQSMRNVRTDAATDASHVALMRVRPGLVGYDTAKARAHLREVLTRLEALPGVQAATLAGTGEVWFYGFSARVWRPGQAPAAGAPQPEIPWKQVGPGFFPTMGISLVEGREIDARDRVGSPRVVVVNETLARSLWPDGSVIGRQLVVQGAEATVVGIARHRRVRKSSEGDVPVVFTAFWQDTTAVEARLAVRLSGDAAASLALLERTARAVDGAVPVYDVVPLERQVTAEFTAVRLAGSAISYASLLAMILSALGLYGVLSFTVTSRTREIAVRVALGARHADVARAVYRHAVRVVAVGVVFGLAASWAAARLLASFLYGAGTASPLFAVVALALLAVVSLAAATVPLRRALRIEPREALQA